MNLRPTEVFSVVSNALEGDAREEFNQRLDDLKVSGAYTTEHVDAVMKALIELFDGGQHAMLLIKWRSLMQLKGETTVKFRTRFMRVISALAVYGYDFTPEQLVVDFSTRLRNWRAIAAHKPKSIDELLAAVAKSGGDDQGDGKSGAVAASQLMTINQADFDGSSQSVSSILMVGSNGRSIKCWNCREQGHHWRDCSKPRVGRCFSCGSLEHFKNKCDGSGPNGGKSKENAKKGH